MADTKKGLWDQYTDWIMKEVYPPIKPYLDKMPHLGMGLKKFFLTLTMIGMYLSIVFVPLGALFSIIGILGGIRGIIAMVYMIALAYGVIVSFKPVTNKTPRGWEYLIAYSLLGIIYQITMAFINLLLGHGAGIGSIIGSLIGAFLSLWISTEIKELFNNKA